MRDRRKIAGLYGWLLVVVVACACLSGGAAEALRRGDGLPRRLTLTGLVSLEYEKKWLTNNGFEQETSKFLQEYRLGASGPILNPKLAVFKVSGTFVESDSDVYGYTSKGFNMNLSFFNGLNNIRSKRFSFINYLPRPLRFNYSKYYIGSSTSTLYGVSAQYYLPVYFQFFGGGSIAQVKNIYEPKVRKKYVVRENTNQGYNYYNNMNNNVNNNNLNNNLNNRNNNLNNRNANLNNMRRRGWLDGRGLVIPFPRFFFDFQRNEYDYGSGSRDNTSYDTRGVIASNSYYHSLAYTNTETEDNGTSTQTERLLLETSNDFGNELSWRNTYDDYSRDSDEHQSFRTSLHKRFRWGRDTMMRSTLSGSYSRSEGTVSEARSYLMEFSDYLDYRITPLITSRTELRGDYQLKKKSFPADEDTFYTVLFAEQLNAVMGRGLNVRFRTHVGMTESGAPYGLSLGFSTRRWRRLNLYGDYTFGVRYVKEDRGTTTTHSYQLGITTYWIPSLSSDLSFRHINTSVKNGQAFQTTSDSVYARVFWNVSRRQRVTLTGQYEERESGESGLQNEETRHYSMGGYYNLFLLRNLFFTLSYTKSEYLDTDRLYEDLLSKMTWVYGKTYFTVEYRMRKEEDELSLDRTEKRLFARLTRYFSR